MAGRVEAYALANEMIWLASRPVSSAPHAPGQRQEMAVLRPEAR
jgi:hypothetical protein